MFHVFFALAATPLNCATARAPHSAFGATRHQADVAHQHAHAQVACGVPGQQFLCQGFDRLAGTPVHQPQEITVGTACINSIAANKA